MQKTFTLTEIETFINQMKQIYLKAGFPQALTNALIEFDLSEVYKLLALINKLEQDPTFENLTTFTTNITEASRQNYNRYKEIGCTPEQYVTIKSLNEISEVDLIKKINNFIIEINRAIYDKTELNPENLKKLNQLSNKISQSVEEENVITENEKVLLEKSRDAEKITSLLTTLVENENNEELVLKTLPELLTIMKKESVQCHISNEQKELFEKIGNLTQEELLDALQYKKEFLRKNVASASQQKSSAETKSTESKVRFFDKDAPIAKSNPSSSPRLSR